ncbi:MAG TPA: SPOR domain-containing protein [Myxococcaceae bacterium]|nr:SPOR domain-containing protein [Myxococcaceae bacterium]
MRDAHRMKDKFDLSLDSRQIVSLLVAGMVVLGAVFVLGVVVGKKLSEADRAAQSHDLLTALDEKAAAMQKVNEEPPLTFQKTLTEKAPPPEPSKPAKVEAPRPAEPPKVAEAAKPEPAKVAEAPRPAPPPVEEAEAPKPAKVEAPRPAVAEAPKGTVPQTPVATRTAPAEARDPARAKTVKLAVPPPRAPMPAAAPQGGWTLQLHASQDKADADRFAASMREKGYAPYLVDADVPGRGTWHRVRLGGFPSKDAAAKYLADFKRETGMDAFVAPAQ